MRKKRCVWKIDLTEHRFDRWLVLSKVPERDKYGQVFWNCRCDCGNEKIVPTASLRSGRSRSCGCLTRDVATTHAMEGTRVYSSWTGMIQRCENPNSQQYENYGGRGIAVCKRWRQSFENFLADMGDRPSGMTIDRIDFNKGYEPGNCRWATAVQQVRNRRNTLRLTWRGETKPHAEWSEITGVPVNVIRSRVRSRWPIERILTEPYHERSPISCPHGHPYVAGSYSLGSYRSKVCLICKREQSRLWREKQRHDAKHHLP